MNVFVHLSFVHQIKIEPGALQFHKALEEESQNCVEILGCSIRILILIIIYFLNLLAIIITIHIRSFISFPILHLNIPAIQVA